MNFKFLSHILGWLKPDGDSGWFLAVLKELAFAIFDMVNALRDVGDMSGDDKRRYIQVVICDALAAPGAGRAEDLEATLREAVAGYAEALDTEERELRIERFRRVERLFSTAAQSGHATADLYANLGNAALQAEHLGNAVLAAGAGLRERRRRLAHRLAPNQDPRRAAACGSPNRMWSGLGSRPTSAAAFMGPPTLLLTIRL